MKHYRSFRMTMEVIRLILAAIMTAAFVYFVWNFVTLIPIYN